MAEDPRPGVPLASGFRRLTDEEQAEARRRHAAMMARLQPRLDEMDRVRRKAAAEAITAVICGG